MTKPSVIRKVAAATALLALPVAVAWSIGPFTIDDPHPDYAVRPPAIPLALERLVGIGSLLIVAGAVVALTWSWRAQPPRSGWVWVVAPLVLVGVILGVSYRVVTAQVIGANIGAGMVLLFGPPAVATLILVAVICSWWRRAHAHVEHLIDRQPSGSPISMHARLRSSGLLGKSIDVGTDGYVSVVGRLVSWTEGQTLKWTVDAGEVEIEQMPGVINHDLVLRVHGDRWPLIIDDRRLRTSERGVLIARRRRDAATTMHHMIENAKQLPPCDDKPARPDDPE